MPKAPPRSKSSSAKKTRPAVIHRFPPKKKRSAPPVEKALPFEVDPGRLEEGLAKLKDELLTWAKRGRYTKVRFKFRGKQLLPDIPLAAVVAAQGVTFYWGGILRALIFNLAGKAVLDVELVNDSEKVLQQGKEELLAGDLDKALASFRRALDMDRDNPAVHLNLGVAHKLRGDAQAARQALEKAKALGKEGPIAAEAERILAGLAQPG